MSHDPTASSEEMAAAGLFDPVAWEHRVAKARARRLETLAKRRPAPLEMCGRGRPAVRGAASAEMDGGFAPAAGRGRRVWPHPRLFAVFLAGLGIGLALAYGGPSERAAAPVATAVSPVSSVTAEAPPDPVVPVAATLALPAFPSIPAPEEAPREVRAAEPEPDAAEAEPVVPPGTRLVVHAPRGLSGTALEGVLDNLRTLDVEIGTTHRVGMAIDTSNIRYFFDADRERAAAVAALAPAGAAPLVLRDFTHLSPRPRPGTLELWLAGGPGGTRQARAEAAVDPARLRSLVEAARDDGSSR